MPSTWSRGRTISPSARGDTTDAHGTLQRLLDGSTAPYTTGDEGACKRTQRRDDEQTVDPNVGRSCCFCGEFDSAIESVPHANKTANKRSNKKRASKTPECDEQEP
jgi:hypothetical protein